MPLPTKYKWIETVGLLPKLVSSALQYLGLKEIPGVDNNPVIMDMAKGLGVSDIYTNDDQSWCAVFINHLIRISGKPIDLHPADRYDLLRALKTAPLFNIIPKKEWVFGDIVKIKRPGGGHVFIAIAKTPKGIVGLGGNQSNSVTFSEFDEDRIVEVRRYYETEAPPSAKQYKMDSTGSLSVNEA